MRIVIIGSSGFVGTNLDFQLFANQILLVDRLPWPNNLPQHVDFLIGNICEKRTQAYISNWEPTHVINLAGFQYGDGIPRARRKVYFAQNLEIARSLVEIISRTSSIKHITHISTDMVYGIAQSDEIDELTMTRPLGPYGASKLEAERIIMGCNVKAAIIRPRLIVGMGRVGTIALFKNLLMSGLPIPVIGKGENCYQMISVLDLWRAIALVSKAQAVGVYNVGSDNPPKLRTLLPELVAALDKKNRVLFLPKKPVEAMLNILDIIGLSPLAPEQYLIASANCKLDTSLIKNNLGWHPEYSDLEILTSIFQEQ